MMFAASVYAAEPNFHDFDGYQQCLTKSVIATRLKNYLVKDRQIKQHYRLSDTHFFLYASASDKKAHRPEYTLRLGSLQVKKQKAIVSGPSDRPLLGVRIAIDPSFIGGQMAYLENRYVALGATSVEQMIVLGDMTLMLAKSLQSLLEQQGATVMLTRRSIGKNVYSQTFYEWLASQSSAPAIPAMARAHSYLFKKIFNPDYELAARVESINHCKPDLTIVLSFNILSSQDPHYGLHRGTDTNVSLAFMPGAFMSKELQTKRSRYEFMRLLVSDCLEQSACLCQSLLSELSRDSALSCATAKEFRQSDSCALSISPGLWARNLALTRRVQSPVCYLLASCADNYQEARSLERSLHTSPSRIDELAKHCLAGINRYIFLQAR